MFDVSVHNSSSSSVVVVVVVVVSVVVSLYLFSVNIIDIICCITKNHI